MIQQVTTPIIQQLLDELQFPYTIKEPGVFFIKYPPSESYPNTFLLYVVVEDDDHMVQVSAQSDAYQLLNGSALKKAATHCNDHNRSNRRLTAYIDDNNSITVEEAYYINHPVSKEYLKQNCLFESIAGMYQFFKLYDS